jgi:hypothetical protein
MKMEWKNKILSHKRTTSKDLKASKWDYPKESKFFRGLYY